MMYARFGIVLMLLMLFVTFASYHVVPSSTHYSRCINDVKHIAPCITSDGYLIDR